MNGLPAPPRRQRQVPLRVYAVEAWHELRAGLQSSLVPVMFVGLVGYVVMALSSAEYLRDMGGADVPRNSSLIVYQITSGQAFWLIFVWAWVFAQVVARDHGARLQEVVLATPISLRGLLFARYLGALVLACILGSSSSVALLLVPVLGALGAFPAGAVGPTPALAIGHAWLLFVLPSAAGLGALYVMAALRTRSATGPFAASAVIILLWMAAMVILRGADIHSDLATLIDVSGFGEAEHQTKLWTPAQKRSTLMALTPPLAWNRALWSLVPLGLFALMVARVQREALVLERAPVRIRGSQRQLPLARPGQILGPVSEPSWWRASLCEARWQATRMLFGWPFLVAMLLFLFLNVAAPFAHLTAHAEGPLVPRGQLLAPFLLDLCYLFSIFGVAGFVGALVRRDQQPGFSELIDSTLAPLGVRVLGSALAASLVTLVLVLIPALAAWMVMGIAVPQSFDLWSPLLVAGLMAAPALLELGGVTFLIHALVRSPGTAHALAMFAALVAVVNHELGIVSYPPAKLGIPARVALSDLTGFSPWLAAVGALDVLELAGAALLVALAWLAYSRGTALTAGVRLRAAAHRLWGGAGALGLAALLLLVATASLLHDRLVTRGGYRSALERESDDARWEQRFWSRATPFSIASADADSTIDPGALRARSRVQLRGVHSASGRLFGELPEGTRAITAAVGGAPRSVVAELEHFELELGACPAEGCDVTIELDIATDGWRLQNEPPWFHGSGVWSRAADLLPRLGLDAERKLRSPTARRAHGLSNSAAPVVTLSLAPVSGVLLAGSSHWRVRVTQPGLHTALEGQSDGPLDFAFAWLPGPTGELLSHANLKVLHGATRADVALDIAEDVRALRSCVEARSGLPVEVDTVLQVPRGLGSVAQHGRVLWIPEQEGWDVSAHGVGHTKRRVALARAMSASALARAAALRVEPGSRFLTSGVAGFIALACVRELDGSDRWLAWLSRQSDHVAEELGALDAPLVSLTADGPAPWVEQYAPLATLAWARALSPQDVRSILRSLLRHVRAGKTVPEGLTLAVGAKEAEQLLGVPHASDVAIAPNGTLVEARGQRSRWAGGGWEAARAASRVTEQLESGSSRVAEAPLVLDERARATVFDAEPSFERSPLDNVWPRPSR